MKTGKSYYSDEIAHTCKILKDFLNYTKVIKGKSNLTVEQYYLDLRTFFRFLKLSRNLIGSATEFENIDIVDVDIALIRSVTVSDIYEFMNFCIDDRDNNANTRARKTSSLRSFYKYLTKNVMLIQENPMENIDTPKTAKKLPKYLTIDQCEQLLRVVDGTYKERDYCILVFFLNCGLRLSALCGINLSDIGSDRHLRVMGKGSKERILYLNDACVEALNAYLRVRPVDGVIDKDALFIGRSKKRLSNKTVQHIVNVNLEKAGLGGMGLSTHKLRHTAATLMYQYGNVDVRVLKDFLGHVNLNTTQIYTHLSQKSLEEAANSNPLANLKKDKNK